MDNKAEGSASKTISPDNGGGVAEGVLNPRAGLSWET